MYGEWVTLPELNGNVIVRVFVHCSPTATPEEKESLAIAELSNYLSRLEGKAGGVL